MSERTTTTKNNNSSLIDAGQAIAKYSVIGAYIILIICLIPFGTVFCIIVDIVYLVLAISLNLGIFLAIGIVLITSSKDRIVAFKAMIQMLLYALFGIIPMPYIIDFLSTIF